MSVYSRMEIRQEETAEQVPGDKSGVEALPSQVLLLEPWDISAPLHFLLLSMGVLHRKHLGKPSLTVERSQKTIKEKIPPSS